MLAIAETSPAARNRAQRAYPSIQVTSDVSEVISSAEIDAVAVVTPVWTHYALTKAALENGKHVFVEKPFTSNAAQGEELINLARQKNLKIMVDHTFLFTGAVKKISQLLDEGSLGSSTTTIRLESTWGFSSTISTFSGTLRRTISPSWITLSKRARGHRRDRPDTSERL